MWCPGEPRHPVRERGDDLLLAWHRGAASKRGGVAWGRARTGWHGGGRGVATARSICGVWRRAGGAMRAGAEGIGFAFLSFFLFFLPNARLLYSQKKECLPLGFGGERKNFGGPCPLFFWLMLSLVFWQAFLWLMLLHLAPCVHLVVGISLQ